MEAERGGRQPRAMILVVSAVAIVAATGVATAEPGPQNTVRRFCRADATGARVFGVQWGRVAELVAWPFDPAWDRVLFVTGYRIGPPRGLEDGRVAVDVDYGVVGEATVTGFEPGVHVESVTFVLDDDAGGQWRIISPLLPPHVFGHRVRADEIVGVLAGGRGRFLASSVFVQRLLRAAGWDVPYVPTSTLLSEGTYAEVSAPARGDLVVYVQDGLPYHVGLLEAPGRVVSTTSNAGVVRSTLNAFPGEVRYGRLAGVGRLAVLPSVPGTPAKP